MSTLAKRVRAAVSAELAAIYAQHGGLEPPKVHDWAKGHPRSAIYSRLEWDDRVGGYQYRLWQIQHLIVEVEVEYPDGKKRQVYVSPVQRRGPRGGYIALTQVMSDREKRRQFLAQALAEYERVGEKYRDLAELAGVREAVKRARFAVRANGRKRAA